ncbi:MAG: sirohydrochlorin cobaltochelatase [Tepidanaerobacteraceae bacterium]|nr:sirohydrochlorin cobaltochelatase [Tepidanaerobacteraceae bacterium]
MKTLLLVAHGSRDGNCTQVMEEMIKKAKSFGKFELVEAAYVQFQRPTIKEAVDKLASLGAGEIWAVPVFLFEGVHVKHDIPRQLREAATAHPDVRVFLTRPLCYDERLVDIIFERLAGEKTEMRD